VQALSKYLKFKNKNAPGRKVANKAFPNMEFRDHLYFGIESV
jgi:hypothetical protein